MMLIYKQTTSSTNVHGLIPKDGFWSNSMVWGYGMNVAQSGVSGSSGYVYITQIGNTLSWYNAERADYQLNTTTNGENIYHYIAIG